MHLMVEIDHPSIVEGQQFRPIRSPGTVPIGHPSLHVVLRFDARLPRLAPVDLEFSDAEGLEERVW